MGDIWLLDANLNRIYIVDDYASLIWVNSYNGQGECEIKLTASTEVISRLREATYIGRTNDEMVCRIENLEIDTDEDYGDFIIVRGYDIKKILNQRIIWKQTNVNGLVEDYIRKLITENIISPDVVARKIDNFTLAHKIGFTEKTKEQVTYDSVGDKIMEICKTYGWGYRVTVDDGKFLFGLYNGENRSNLVMFSNQYENIAGTIYKEDNTNIANVALTAGEGEGTERAINVEGNASGLERFEIYVDARDISKTINHKELLEAYPGGVEVSSGGVIYYRVDGQNIATITKGETGEVESVELLDVSYIEALRARGKSYLAERIPTKEFVGEVEPSMTFEYKKDYFLGDIVAVENEYGISIEARIAEMMEVDDENGYSIKPTFEFFDSELANKTRSE